jgi:hypothetical protein
VAVEPGVLSLQPVAQLSVGFVAADEDGRAGSAKTLWSGCAVVDAVLDRLAPERPVDVVGELTLVIIGDLGTSSGGAATDE